LSRRKLVHFAEMDQMPHVFQYPENMPGQWSVYFGNDAPLILEVGCGTGRYTVGLAELYPQANYIGTDIKGARMWHGATYVRDKGIKNAAFLRSRVEQIDNYFAPGEVSEIWITFPDPQPRESRERKRLPSKRFLELYTKILKPGGKLYLKTDNADLFAYATEVWQTYTSLEIVQYSTDLYTSGIQGAPTAIQTVYEERYRAQGIPINFMETVFHGHAAISAP
jgi:tRNA (guanine-N7-)-methyltransferase